MTECFSFSEALTRLEQGKKITRKENKFVFDGNEYSVEYLFLQHEEVWLKTAGNAPYPMKELKMWLTLDDILAKDWYEVK